jgi:hypothetical protein
VDAAGDGADAAPTSSGLTRGVGLDAMPDALVAGSMR